jgi:hypothetical protein
VAEYVFADGARAGGRVASAGGGQVDEDHGYVCGRCCGASSGLWCGAWWAAAGDRYAQGVAGAYSAEQFCCLFAAGRGASAGWDSQQADEFLWAGRFAERAYQSGPCRVHDPRSAQSDALGGA